MNIKQFTQIVIYLFVIKCFCQIRYLFQAMGSPMCQLLLNHSLAVINKSKYNIFMCTSFSDSTTIYFMAALLKFDHAHCFYYHFTKSLLSFDRSSYSYKSSCSRIDSIECAIHLKERVNSCTTDTIQYTICYILLRVLIHMCYYLLCGLLMNFHS